MTIHRWKTRRRPRISYRITAYRRDPYYHFWQAFVPRPTRDRDAYRQEKAGWETSLPDDADEPADAQEMKPPDVSFVRGLLVLRGPV